MIAGLAAVIVWGTLATYWGLPVSITHSFVSGLAAAGAALVGVSAIQWAVMGRVLSSVRRPASRLVPGLVLQLLPQPRQALLPIH